VAVFRPVRAARYDYEAIASLAYATWRIFPRNRRDRDLAAEMESHLAMHIEDNLRAGMSAAEARREGVMKLAALNKQGNYRDRRGPPPWTLIARPSLRPSHAAARIRFPCVAVLTLALVSR